MSKEVEKISTQVCLGCSMKNIQAFLIPSPTTISSGTADRKTQKKKNYVGVPRASNDFEIATSLGLMDGFFTNHECIPSLESAYLKFKQVYPAYQATESVDQIRDKEYSHLQSNNHVCMDYFGFGLYSRLQFHHDVFSSSFSLSYMSANLSSHALYGAAEPDTLEFHIKNRIMKFLRIQERDDYSVVFTSSRGSAFELLAESYPFHVNKRLLTVYDYEDEGLNRMVESAKLKGAKTMSALFKWPSLRICSDQLKTALTMKKKRKTPKEASAEGLFVFPVQSRVTGAKYSYQWMSHAQRNGWHVLLDASALGSKDMDSLGLSMFLPEFIICSFYKVYGEDPTGFGCLFVKNSAMPCLHTSSTARGIGMVKIVPICKSISPLPANDEIHDGLRFKNPDANVRILEVPDWGLKNKQLLTPTSFSGPISALYTGDQAQNSVLHITESDQHHKSDAESFAKNDFGRETESFRYHHARSSFDMSSRSSDGDVNSFRNIGGESEYERSSLKQENLEGIAELEEKENPFPKSDFMHSNGIEENEENIHLGHLREKNIWNKRMDPSETSGIDREPPSQEVVVTKFRDPSDTGDTGRYNHEAPLEDEPKWIQSESVNGNVVIRSSKSQILFRGLDHADSLGLNRGNIRLRYLINWLVNALSKLCHPPSEQLCHLVKIYGAQVKYNRGPSIAFNLYDWKDELVEPLFVQKLADRSNISLGYGVLHNIWFPEKYEGSITLLETKNGDGTTVSEHLKHQGTTTVIPVVSAALSFVTNFEDVYRLWSFVAKFLDADFVDKERWRYRGLNQKTIEL